MPTGSLIELRVLNSISLEQMNQILEKSPRLKAFEWSKLTLMREGGDGGWNLQDTVIPMVIWVKLARLMKLEELTLKRWELPWEELMLLLRSNPGLRKLRLTSMRRDLKRIAVASPNGQRKGDDEKKSTQDQTSEQQALMRRIELQAEDNSFLNVTDLTMGITRSFDDTSIDLVALCPRLQRLCLKIECRFDVFAVIGHLRRFQKQYGSSLSSPSTSPPQSSWSLNTIEIAIRSSLSDDYFPFLTDDSLVTLVRSAQPTGLTKFKGDLHELTKELVKTLISPSLTEFRGSDTHDLTKSFAEALINPLRSLDSPIHSNLTELDIRISHTAHGVVSSVHAILGFCTWLKKFWVDLMGEFLSPEDAEIMFCGLDERAIADPRASWSCKGLELFKWMGIQAPPEIHFITLVTSRKDMQEKEEEEEEEESQFDAMNVSEDKTEKIVNGDNRDGGQPDDEGEQVEPHYTEDEEGYDPDVYGYNWIDHTAAINAEESLSSFAVQVIAQSRHLPELKQLSLNGIDYIIEIRRLGGLSSQNDPEICIWPCGYRHKPCQQPRQQHEE
ncbi:hypothetical protein BGZ58_000209 [Dissophora ornata]|nr:hypothetical protein BGZ58_000209 [Dissophora ornata]